MPNAKLSQDPHKTGERQAEFTGLSVGMLSRIENGVTSPSLTTLQALSSALNVPVTAFFAGFREIARRCMWSRAKGLRLSAQARARGMSVICQAI